MYIGYGFYGIANPWTKIKRQQSHSQTKEIINHVDSKIQSKKNIYLIFH
jgi:hypothetical protein